MSDRLLHPVAAIHTVNDQSIVQIDREVCCDIYKSGADDGYHAYMNDWWSNGGCQYSYQYISVDSMYPQQYFTQTGHPSETRASEIFVYMQKVYRSLFQCDFQSILELGTGGGEITQIFHKENLDYLAVEGTAAGVERLIASGINPDQVRNYNLKFMPSLDRRFDIVMCTEVAEHIEPFFASKIVENCINHADLVWFSAADRNRRAHYHHINEQPIEVWDNLFAHMGYNYFIKLSGLHDRASRLYLSQVLGRRLSAVAARKANENNF